jgi:hypothetical protein
MFSDIINAGAQATSYSGGVNGLGDSYGFVCTTALGAGGVWLASNNIY